MRTCWGRAAMAAPLLFASASVILGQSPEHPAIGAASQVEAPAPAAEPENEPSLPEVLVRPDSADGISETTDTGPAPTLPPSDDVFNRALSYPSLTQQAFGGLTSALRSEQSIFDATQFATIMTQQQLIERTAQDMFQALQQEAGVFIQRTARGQASPFIRGLTGQQVLILVDGIRLNNGTFRAGANQYFNTIDPGQVERIEVIRGPLSVLYGGDGIGGVINVVTKSADRGRGNYLGGSLTEFASTADLGTYTRANFEGFSGSSGVFAGASYLNLNDLDRGGGLGRQPFTGYDQYAADIKFDHLLDPNHLFTAALSHLEQDSVPRSDRFAPFALGPPVATVRPTFFDPQQRDLGYLRLQGVNLDSWCDAYAVTASYARQKEGSREIRSATRTDVGEFDVNTAGLSALAATDFDFAGRLTYGFDWFSEDVDSFRFRVNPLAGTAVPDIPQFPDNSFYERFGVFLNHDLLITQRLGLIAGVRFENVDLRSTPIVVVDPPGPAPPIEVPTPIAPSFQDWSTSVGLSYELDPAVRLVGTISEGFRAPNLDDLVATNTLVQQDATDIPSLTLLPENAWSYEVGVKINGSRLRAQTYVYWVDLGDDILRTPVATGVFQRNNRDSFVQGCEGYLEYLLGGGWSAYGNFAYTFGKDRELSIPLSRIPPTQGVLGLRWRDATARHWIDAFAWLVREQDRLNFQDFTDARIPLGGTPGFQTVNLRVGTTRGSRQQHRFSLTWENIFDQAYRVHGSGVDGPGINAVFGYTLLR